jgi:predicted RNA-binding Zn-ribbon protein involved in translation (DUF1610 family)
MDKLEHRAAETGRVYCPDCEVALDSLASPTLYQCPQCGTEFRTHSTESGRTR